MRYGSWTDSLAVPVISDKYPKLKKALSEQVIFDGDSLNSVVKKFETEGHGITEVSYKVSYETKDVISIKFYYEGYGAHPTDYWVLYTLNIHTGKPDHH
jgi:hypothetical protein